MEVCKFFVCIYYVYVVFVIMEFCVDKDFKVEWFWILLKGVIIFG